jgi:hypothetical protein
MDFLNEYFLVVVLIIIFAYGIFSQVKELMIIKSNKPFKNKYKRLIIGNYISIISYAGLLISFVLNIFIFLNHIQGSLLTSSSTNNVFLIFLILLFVSKFWITPKNHY